MAFGAGGIGSFLRWAGRSYWNIPAPLAHAPRLSSPTGARSRPTCFLTSRFPVPTIAPPARPRDPARSPKSGGCKRHDCTSQDRRKNASPAMRTPPVVSPEAWEAARQRLLVKEKAHTRARDALAAERRRMPWMAVKRTYAFEGPEGKASLLDLFDGRRQLIVYRAFFEPGVFGWPEHACEGCSMVADQVAHVAHLNARDTTLVVRLARAAAGHRAPEGADGLGDDTMVHHHGRLRRRLRRGRVARHERVLSATAIACSAPTSSTTAATSRWAAPGTTSTSRRSAGRRAWEDSPEGYPQTPPYTWWKWHDSYARARRPTRNGSRCRTPERRRSGSARPRSVGWTYSAACDRRGSECGSAGILSWLFRYAFWSCIRAPSGSAAQNGPRLSRTRCLIELRQLVLSPSMKRRIADVLRVSDRSLLAILRGPK